jgi:drug/metabolite transporter (DMT)-like permease
VWLLHHQAPTLVGTYAYINPVVAVLIGYLLAGEPLTRRTVLGTLLVLLSVVVITTARASKATTGPPSKA